MAKAEDAAISIGAVTHLTGVSTHTLRKWESRYGIVEPQRTPTGRRVYNQSQVRKLIVLRELVEQGHQISHLSELSDDELEALAGQPAGREPAIAFASVTVIGQVLKALMSRERLNADIFEFVDQLASSWLADAAAQAELPQQPRALIVELPTISQASLLKLLELRRQGYERVIVVYGFTARATVRKLLDGGILCLKAPVSAREILQNVAHSAESPSVQAFLGEAAIPTQRFSLDSIAAMAGISPDIQCECPNHIAQLLMDISAFEQYSMECEDTDPSERELHARLRLIAANARALFEEAMENVARAEGLKLEEIGR